MMEKTEKDWKLRTILRSLVNFSKYTNDDIAPLSLLRYFSVTDYVTCTSVANKLGRKNFRTVNFRTLFFLI